MSKVFKNTNFTKRDYECTNVVFASGENAPHIGNWVETNDFWEDHEGNLIFGRGISHLYTQDGIRYYGWL